MDDTIVGSRIDVAARLTGAALQILAPRPDLQEDAELLAQTVARVFDQIYHELVESESFIALEEEEEDD